MASFELCAVTGFPWLDWYRIIPHWEFQENFAGQCWAQSDWPFKSVPGASKTFVCHKPLKK